MTTPRIPAETHSPAPVLAPARLADAGSEYERILLAAAAEDRAPVPSAERWTALLEGARAARQDPSAQQRASHEATQPSAAQPSPAAALQSWKPWVMGVIAAGAIGAWGASRESAVVRVDGPPPLPAPIAAETGGRESLSDRDEARDVRAAASAAAHPERDGASGPQRSPSLGANREQPRVAARRAQSPAVRAVRSPPVRGAAPGAGSSRSVELRSALGEEVRAIESIQALLGWGDAERAAGELAAYRQRFPQGALALEADVLDIDVALARGERGRARELARVLLERPEARRYRPRLEALAEGSNQAPAQMNERR
jgi:hypothetical protein